MDGPMVIAYQDGDRIRLDGGIAPEDVDLHRQAMEEELGLTIIRVFDGLAEAKQKFPPGTRVAAPRKWWKSQLGTVVTDAEIQACSVANCHAHGWRWDNVPVRFDGDEGVLGWWPSGLEVIGHAEAATHPDPS
jgi:hypothetical protein